MSYHFANVCDIFFAPCINLRIQYLQVNQKQMDKQISREVVARTYIFTPLHIIQVAGGIPGGGNDFYTTHYKIGQI